MMPRWAALSSTMSSGLMAALIALAGCHCGSSPAVAPDAAADVLPRDTSVDRGVDSGDLYAPGGCGGKRTLAPTLVPHGDPALDCGVGCRQLTWTQNPDELRFDAHGGILTFVSQFRANHGDYAYYVDLSSGNEYRLNPPHPNSSHGCSRVATDGKRIAMTCVREGLEAPKWKPTWLRSLTVFDPATNVEEDLLCLERRLDDDSCFPSAIGLTDHGFAIRISLGACIASSIYHLPSGGTSLVDLAPTSHGNEGLLHAEGNYLVWMERRSGWKSYQIVLYDLRTKTSRRVAPTDYPQSYPRLGGGKIVWVDQRNDPKGDWMGPRNGDIYVHDIASGKTEVVIDHPADQGGPDVSGKWVVWHDFRDSPLGYGGTEIDVWAKNLETGKIHQVTDDAKYEVFPRVDSGRAFFVKPLGPGHQAIFMIDLAKRLGL
jgi:hypothetical protein